MQFQANDLRLGRGIESFMDDIAAAKAAKEAK